VHTGTYTKSSSRSAVALLTLIGRCGGRSRTPNDYYLAFLEWEKGFEPAVGPAAVFASANARDPARQQTCESLRPLGAAPKLSDLQTKELPPRPISSHYYP
jgi:hypothetical protein